MDNAGVLNFNSAEVSSDTSSCASDSGTPLTPVRPRLGRFLDVYSPEHLNLTPKPKTKIFNQVRNESPITLTPEKYCSSDYELQCRSVKTGGRVRRVFHECSFEGNQSFPRVRRRRRDMEPDARAAPDIVRVDGPNGLRFSAAESPASGAGPHVPPGKAVFTIEAHSSKILIVNSAACSLLGYSAGELSGVKFAELVRGGGGALSERGAGARGVLVSGKVVELRRRGGGGVQASLWVRQLEPDGPRLVVAEPVAARCAALVVDEGGAVRGARGDLDVFGADCADRLLGLDVHQLIPSLRLPSPAPPPAPPAPPAAGDQPELLAKQKATGRTLDGGCFPLCLWISRPAESASWLGKTKDNVKERRLLEVNIRVTCNVSGLLVVDEAGVVTACNHHFLRLTFGKGQHEVVGRRVDALIHHFCRATDALRLELLPGGARDRGARDDTDLTLSPLSARTRDSTRRSSPSPSPSRSASPSTDGEGEVGSQRSAGTSHVHCATSTQDMVSSLSTSQRLPELVSGLSLSDATLPSRPAAAPPAPRLDLSPPGSDETSADFLTPINELPPSTAPQDLDLDPPPLNDSLGTESAGRGGGGATSTPARGGGGSGAAAGGTYRGTALHKDGTELPVVYTVSCMQAGGARVRCVWVGVALEGPRHATRADSATPDSELVLAGSSTGCSRPASASLASLADRSLAEQLAGDYSRQYVTLNQIGKGAFGSVRLAYRATDRLLVVTKFILKEKVGAGFWVDASDGRRLPLELSLLLELDHPNIVRVLSVYENDKYFQMVMEKHGAPMDLFEFIERRPRLDEPLLSYIFRQLCEAVRYLHSLRILHRDIKDENVIIDDKFHVKLIDFGSAAFLAPDGGTFGTFYGTTEYCSPEVLAGARYAGPELEVWALGVTLYVLCFARAPFADVEDALRGELALPAPVSAALEAVLRALLAREPAARVTLPALLRHAWLALPVAVERYAFHEVLECSALEAAPPTHYAGAAPPRADSSAELLSSRGRGEAEGEVTSLSEDATGHAAADLDPDHDHDVELDSWDECDQDSLS